MLREVLCKVNGVFEFFVRDEDVLLVIEHRVEFHGEGTHDHVRYQGETQESALGRVRVRYLKVAEMK